MTEPIAPYHVFVSYAHRDERYLKQLVAHLSTLRREGLIHEWHDREISAGENWARQIEEQLERADIILLLVSADFLRSDYCYTKEMVRAVQRHEAGRTRVIPIIVRPCDWTRTPFARLQALPSDGKPVTDWASRDRAWMNVVSEVRSAIDRLTQDRVRVPPGSDARIPLVTEEPAAGWRLTQNLEVIIGRHILPGQGRFKSFLELEDLTAPELDVVVANLLELISDTIAPSNYDCVLGAAGGHARLVKAVASSLSLPWVLVRDTARVGSWVQTESTSRPGRGFFIDDVSHDAGRLMARIDRLRTIGYVVSHCFVAVDRVEGDAGKGLAAQRVQLSALRRYDDAGLEALRVAQEGSES